MKNKIKGCGCLFKIESGNILVCGEQRDDGNCFLCPRCLKFPEQYRKIVEGG